MRGLLLQHAPGCLRRGSCVSGVSNVPQAQTQCISSTHSSRLSRVSSTCTMHNVSPSRSQLMPIGSQHVPDGSQLMLNVALALPRVWDHGTSEKIVCVMEGPRFHAECMNASYEAPFTTLQNCVRNCLQHVPQQFTTLFATDHNATLFTALLSRLFTIFHSTAHDTANDNAHNCSQHYS